jgi:hypothetical protein
MEARPPAPQFLYDLGLEDSSDPDTAGLELVADTAQEHPRLSDCLSSTPAARIPLWRIRIRHAFFIAIKDLPVHTIDDVQKAIATIR